MANLPKIESDDSDDDEEKDDEEKDDDGALLRYPTRSSRFALALGACSDSSLLASAAKLHVDPLVLPVHHRRRAEAPEAGGLVQADEILLADEQHARDAL